MVKSNEFCGVTLNDAVRKSTAIYRINKNSLQPDFYWQLSKTFSLKPFDFVERFHKGNNLFVGEGNFSFSLCLCLKTPDANEVSVATVLEHESELSTEEIENKKRLEFLGVSVEFAVDAKNLYSSLKTNLIFDTIIFQFPNVASRVSNEGRTANFILLRDFLLSARDILSSEGIVAVTIVDNEYYAGAFRPDDAAQRAGYLPPEKFSFYLSDYPGYVHSMTNGGDSILERYNAFQTLIFKRGV